MWKLAHRLLLPWKCLQHFRFFVTFGFQVLSLYAADGQTEKLEDRQTDRRTDKTCIAAYYIGRPHVNVVMLLACFSEKNSPG